MHDNEHSEDHSIPPEAQDGPAAITPEEPAPREPAAPAPSAAKPHQEESWLEVVKTIVYALLIALVIRTFIFQPFNIPSGSMKDTLLIGDYLFVSKFSYGYSRHSFPWSLAPFEGRFFARGPERGDVVVFKMPNKNSVDYMKDFIKRVIGLPGDRIQVKHSILYINDKPVPRVPEGTFSDVDENGYGGVLQRYRETLPNGVSYDVLDAGPDMTLDNTEVFTVPEGHYFMMGDNRDDSDDSRAEVGFVPIEDLVGKAQIIFFSVDGSAHIWEFWKWPFAIRYGRIGKLAY